MSGPDPGLNLAVKTIAKGLVASVAMELIGVASVAIQKPAKALGVRDGKSTNIPEAIQQRMDKTIRLKFQDYSDSRIFLMCPKHIAYKSIMFDSNFFIDLTYNHTLT